jgi:hypothetical protein
MFAYLAGITERIRFASGVGLGLDSADAHLDYLASVADNLRRAANNQCLQPDSGSHTAIMANTRRGHGWQRQAVSRSPR